MGVTKSFQSCPEGKQPYAGISSRTRRRPDSNRWKRSQDSFLANSPQTLTERGGAARLLGAIWSAVAGTAGTPTGDGSRLGLRSLHAPRSVSVSREAADAR